MKKHLNLLAISLVLLGCSAPSEFEKFSLESAYYQDGGLIDFSLASQFNQKVEDDESFMVYLYSPTCAGCLTFKPRIQAFATNQDIQVFTLNVSMLEYTPLNGVARYTPSVYLYNQGEMTYMLDPKTKEKDAFNSEDAFTSWFYARVNPLES